MTNLLERAFKEASKLPDLEQNVFAQWVLDELKSEKQWDCAFSNSEDTLGHLAGQAIKEHRKRKTTPLDPDTL